jgi:tetratricopeptide (TPR) repeat protein
MKLQENFESAGTMARISLREKLNRPITFSSDPNNGKKVGHYNEVLSLAAENKHEEALAKFRLALVNSPQVPHAYYNMWLSYCASKQFEEASGCFEKALEIDGKFIEEQNSLGVAHIRLQHGDLALRHFHRALRINPNYYESYSTWARFITSWETLITR